MLQYIYYNFLYKLHHKVISVILFIKKFPYGLHYK